MTATTLFGKASEAMQENRGVCIVGPKLYTDLRRHTCWFHPPGIARLNGRDIHRNEHLESYRDGDPEQPLFYFL